MYIKDKKYRITLRLNEEQFEFVKGSAERLGVSPSQFLRMVVNSSMTAFKQGFEEVNVMIDNANDINDLTK